LSKLLKIDREAMSTIEKCLLARNYPEEISDRQAEMMLHALGADDQPYRTRNSLRYYHACRNHYDAGGSDVAAWDDLVGKGYAEKRRFYHVTVRGIRVLEFLTRCRIWDDRHNTADCRNAVLVELMKDAVSCGYGCWLPTSSREISLRLAIPQNLALDTLKRLADEGLAIKDYYGEMDDEGYVHCKHGWSLTLAAQEKYPEKFEELKQAEYRKINDSLKEEPT